MEKGTYRGERLSQFVDLLVVSDTEDVQVTRAADLELGGLANLVFLNGYNFFVVKLSIIIFYYYLIE